MCECILFNKTATCTFISHIQINGHDFDTSKNVIVVQNKGTSTLILYSNTFKDRAWILKL